MKKNMVVLMMLVLALMIGCGKEGSKEAKKKNLNYSAETRADGVKVVKNNGKGSTPDLNLGLKEILTITGEDNSEEGNKDRVFSKVNGLVVDSKGNIFVGDMGSSSIKKFDKNGKFVKSFGRAGSGPGEYGMLADLCINNDTINVFDPMTNKYVKFNGDGEFIGDKIFTDGSKPMFLADAGSNNLIGLNSVPEMKDGILYFPVNVQLFDSKFNGSTVIDSRKLEFDLKNPQINPTDLFTPFGYSQKKIYIGDVSEDFMKIRVYDLNGKQLEEYSKNYRKSEMTKKQMDSYKSAVQTGGENQNELTKAYNKAIEEMFIDKKGRVWVKKAKTKKNEDLQEVEFDIFENGIYLNKLTLKVGLGKNMLINTKSMFYFFNDHLYYIDENDGDIILKILEYT